MISLIFLFKQKTAYEMRISDWSSDVCSSDLPELLALPTDRPRPPVSTMAGGSVDFTVEPALHTAVIDLARSEGATVFMVLHAALAILLARTAHTSSEEASCRERVCQYV